MEAVLHLLRQEAWPDDARSVICDSVILRHDLGEATEVSSPLESGKKFVDSLCPLSIQTERFAARVSRTVARPPAVSGNSGLPLCPPRNPRPPVVLRSWPVPLGCLGLRRAEASAGLLPLVARIVSGRLREFSMTSLTKRNRSRLRSCFLAVFGILGFPLATVHGQDAKSMKEVYAIDSEWQQTMLKAADVRRNGEVAA